MGKTTTHVVAVIDGSGSMATQADEVRHGFNAYVRDLEERHRMGLEQYSITAVIFNVEATVHCAAAAPSAVPVLDWRNYSPRYSTALLDAVGNAILAFEAATELGIGDQVLLVINTDGKENASKEYNWQRVAEMIAAREATGRWGTIYMGQGVDAWTEGHRFGVNTQTVNTTKDNWGTRSGYRGMSVATVEYATSSNVTAAADAMRAETETSPEEIP